MSTSVSDNNKYPSICARAAEDDDVFSSFKQNAIYTEILEHVTKEIGDDYLKHVLFQNPELQAHFDRFRENDRYGGPRVFSFGIHGTFSPTTLRYIKVAGDLKSFFGDLTNAKVVEIGCGYGGQCKVLSDLFRFNSYTLVDLPSVLRLSEKYLSKLSVPNTSFVTMDNLGHNERYDLVISNYAFSELSRPIQDQYFAKVISNASRGYMILNDFGFGGAHPTLEIASMVKDSILIDETPEMPPHKNKVLVWGKSPRRGERVDIAP